ncbi:MAG: geranylgeranyl reductase family protein [Ilumatobacter sp.]|nr:geranylgeranyl reductase family protein [Ilumatobacter sp.]MDG1697261.1 geranylgeranyl reductase family protein [Ilumatobacter sp.]MDG2438432.1 geranylgeranyl reductase family protein [Ilumatobacter sp.]
MSADPHSTDVLVIGGGPAGSAVAARLADEGHDVTLVEKRAEGRHKSCGDLLSPRAVAELSQLEIDPMSFGGHPIQGVRMIFGRQRADTPWPERHDMPHHAVVIRRDELDEQLRRRARNAGATVLMGHEATTPISERGFVRGATMTLADGTIRDVNARFIVVADGASSRFGRVLGTSRQRRWPYAIAARTYFSSPRHRDAWVETSLGLSDPQGNPVAGYGWVTPMGDGNVNVGVGVLSSYRDIKGLNTLKLLTAFSDHVAADWGLDPTQPLKSPTRLRLPIGGSVGPKMGPTFLVVGDAAGAANPFSGDGIDAALMGGRLAANVLHEALTTGNSTTLQRYPVVVAEEVEAYRKVGRLSARFLGRPAILKPALRLATRSDATMGAVLRIATNALRDDDTAGGAERAYRLASLAAKFAPSW